MKLLYFAWVRQRIGIAEESFELPGDVTSVRHLVTFLIARGNNYSEAFKDLDRVRVAVNQEHVNLDHKIAPGDEVAFFPPVTGGQR
jgi:molybdopterin synthase sulfur carrier subunit